MNLPAALSDMALLSLAVAVLFVPGLLMLLALGQIRPGRRAVAVGAAPAITAGLAYLTAVLAGSVGLEYSLLTVVVTTLVLLAAVVGSARWRSGSWATSAVLRDALPTRIMPVQLAGLALLLAGVLIGLVTWHGGLGSLDTPPQEHDAVTHTLVTANIVRTGLALPGQVSPADLLTGGADNFYPAGMHALSALCAVFGVSPVSAMNAMTVAIFAVALPVGLFGLATTVSAGRSTALVGGGAALAASVSYRPVYAMMHDGGLYANTAALSLTPAVLALLLTAGRRSGEVRGWRSAVDVRQAVFVLVAVVGIFWVHPTAAPLVGITFLAWWTADRWASRAGWRTAGSQLATIAAGGIVAVAVALPIVLPGSALVSTVSGWTRDYQTLSFPDALGRVLGFSYGGYLDQAVQRSQILLALLLLAGLAITTRRRHHAGLLAAWLVWAVVLGAFLMDLSIPGVSLAASLFYNSFIRINAGLMLVSWLLVGVAVAELWSLAGAAARRLPVRVPGAALRGILAGYLALLVVVWSLQTAYRPINGAALSTRFGAPEILRVTEDDLAAIEWLDDEVRPGERVMNSANDGSTYLWVYEGVPVVNTFPLGSANLEYSIPLLTRFNEVDTDPQIRKYVREQNIRWVYVDSDAPPIFIPPEYRGYLDGETFTVPPGLLDLDEVESLDEVFHSGTVRVYEVDPSVFEG